MNEDLLLKLRNRTKEYLRVSRNAKIKGDPKRAMKYAFMAVAAVQEFSRLIVREVGDGSDF